MVLLLLLLGLLIIQYFIARKSLNTIVSLLSSFLPRPVVFTLISLLFFPGTLVHELAHAAMALCLLLPVHSIHLIPSWDHQSIVLGHVTYEKRDIWRGILVGIAPLPVGLFVLWGLLQLHLPTLLTGYLIFAISSTMFSSKSDLIDVIYIIPLAIVLGVVWLAFPGLFTGLFGVVMAQKEFITNVNNFLSTTVYYAGVAIAIHILIIGSGKLLGTFFRR